MMIQNIEHLDIPNIDLYKVTFSEEPKPKIQKKPSIKLNFNSDEDLLRFIINHLAFMPEDEKELFSADIDILGQEEEFSKKIFDAYNERNDER